jgi:hypothetical protein
MVDFVIVRWRSFLFRLQELSDVTPDGRGVFQDDGDSRFVDRMLGCSVGIRVERGRHYLSALLLELGRSARAELLLEGGWTRSPNALKGVSDVRMQGCGTFQYRL